MATDLGPFRIITEYSLEVAQRWWRVDYTYRDPVVKYWRVDYTCPRNLLLVVSFLDTYSIGMDLSHPTFRYMKVIQPDIPQEAGANLGQAKPHLPILGGKGFWEGTPGGGSSTGQNSSIFLPDIGAILKEYPPKDNNYYQHVVIEMNYQPSPPPGDNSFVAASNTMRSRLFPNKAMDHEMYKVLETEPVDWDRFEELYEKWGATNVHSIAAWDIGHLPPENQINGIDTPLPLFVSDDSGDRLPQGYLIVYLENNTIGYSSTEPSFPGGSTPDDEDDDGSFLSSFETFTTENEEEEAALGQVIENWWNEFKKMRGHEDCEKEPHYEVDEDGNRLQEVDEDGNPVGEIVGPTLGKEQSDYKIFTTDNEEEEEALDQTIEEWWEDLVEKGEAEGKTDFEKEPHYEVDEFGNRIPEPAPTPD